MSRVSLVLLAVVSLTACTPSLPDPKSAGGEVYAVRCGSCHAAYAPGTLTSAMWDVQIDRMQRLMQSRGVNPLTEQERFLITSYLRAHSADAPAPSGAPS